MTTASAPARPRQARSRATREHLLAAARRAFAEHGHDGVNLRVHVLEPAGVGVGSFYHQFADKTDLLITLLDEAAEDRRRAVVDDPAVVAGRPPQEVLGEGFARLLADIDASEDLWRIQIRERANPDPRIRRRVGGGPEAWRGDLAATLRATTGAPEAEVARAADLLLSLGVGLAATYLERPRRRRTAAARRELAAGAATFATAGLGALLEGGASDRP